MNAAALTFIHSAAAAFWLTQNAARGKGAEAAALLRHVEMEK